jgi:hypothetical protein
MHPAFVVLFAAACLLSSSPSGAQTYDTELSIAATASQTADSGNGTRTFAFELTVRNEAGRPMRNLVLGLASPYLAAQPIETVSIGALDAGQAASAYGTFELCAPGLGDGPLLGSLLWRVEFDEATGARARRYVKASP